MASKMVVQPPNSRGWLAFACLPVLVAIGILGHAGHFLSLIYTPIAAVIGLYLCFRFPRIYIAFIVVLTCFSPFVRRLADYQSSYTESNPILIAPLLIPALAAFRLGKTSSFRERYLVFLLPLMAVCYGFILGIMLVGGKTVLTASVGWLYPLILGLYCAIYEDDEGGLAKSFLHSFAICVTIVGLYGIFQYFWPPAWDTYWLTQLQLSGSGASMGTPEPLGIRTFSTLNAPEPAAVVLGAGLLALSLMKTAWRYVAIVPVLAALALTAVRSEWIALAAGTLILLVKASNKSRAKFLVAVCILAPLLLVASGTPTGEKVLKRFSSLGSVKQDSSFKDRSGGVEAAIKFIIDRPFGTGIGSLESAQFTKWNFVKVGPHDLGIVELPFAFGYLGTALYGFGILAALSLAIRKGLSSNDRNLTLAILAIHLPFLFPTNNPMGGSMGVIFWVPIGLMLHYFNRDVAASEASWMLSQTAFRRYRKVQIPSRFQPKSELVRTAAPRRSQPTALNKAPATKGMPG